MGSVNEEVVMFYGSPECCGEDLFAPGGPANLNKPQLSVREQAVFVTDITISLTDPVSFLGIPLTAFLELESVARRTKGYLKRVWSLKFGPIFRA
jgi:hypothetical protein